MKNNRQKKQAKQRKENGKNATEVCSTKGAPQLTSSQGSNPLDVTYQGQNAGQKINEPGPSQNLAKKRTIDQMQD